MSSAFQQPWMCPGSPWRMQRKWWPSYSLALKGSRSQAKIITQPGQRSPMCCGTGDVASPMNAVLSRMQHGPDVVGTSVRDSHVLSHSLQSCQGCHAQERPPASSLRHSHGMRASCAMYTSSFSFFFSSASLWQLSPQDQQSQCSSFCCGDCSPRESRASLGRASKDWP